MRIYVYSQKIGIARKEAKRIMREKEIKGKLIFQDGVFIIQTPNGEKSEFTGNKNMNDPTPGQRIRQEVIE